MNDNEQRDKTILHGEMLEQLKMMTSDHEKRIRWLERMAFYACGAVLVAKFVWDFYMTAKTGGKL